MTLLRIDPLTDVRWSGLVDHCSTGTPFHSAAWLESLRRTYGYEPVAYTFAAPGDRLDHAVLFCQVKSWLTGRRLVSLPFSDHCDPLVDDPGMLADILVALERLEPREAGAYIELRPRGLTCPGSGFRPFATYYAHTLDLQRSTSELFAGFHRSCVQRAIRRAEGSGVTCEAGRTASLLAEFYSLHRLTRRRHAAPVQPFAWFRNLVECFGERLRIYVARSGGTAIAALLILSDGRTALYKYGCSDPRYKRLGATPLLFWKTIGDARADGALELDLGRSDPENEGLTTFKDRLGARRSPLTYFRYPMQASRVALNPYPAMARRAYALMPSGMRDRVGARFYRHFA